jgi:amidohydrolase
MHNDSLVATDVSATADAVRDTVVRWRRHLHQHPELSFQEKNTAQFVFDTLRSFGALELSRPTATSVVARLRGAKSGPVLAIRADMDALPIHERTSHDFRSTNPGVMHACGHDGHTAMLLGAAKILSEHQARIRGEIRFIFQHAEELPPGGAQELVDAGVMNGVDAVIGAHLWSLLEAGKVGVITGAAFAAPDNFDLIIRGSGGHAAAPHHTVDSIAVAAQVVTNLQHLVSRNIDPLDSVVVSVTRLIAGSAYNVIPQSAELAGTFRTLDPELRERVPQLMERIIRGICAAHGATYEFRVIPGYRPVVNEARTAEFLREMVRHAVGEEALADLRPTMGAEDFSAYQAKAPGTFILVGARNEPHGIVHPHHHECFDLDEDALDIGTRIFVAAGLEFADRMATR